MFSTTNSNFDTSSLKAKQSSFKKQCTHSSKQSLIQSLRYLSFSERIDWHLPLPAFQDKVSSVFNYYTILNTLFAMSEQMDWRAYIPHMNVLISTFHNIMCGKNGSGLHDIGKISGLEGKLEKLFMLKDLTLHGHLMLLIKMLLAYNPKYGFLKESAFSLILIESATYNDIQTVSQIVWILSQIEVSDQALVKLIKHEGLNEALNKGDFCLLPLLTIVSNFLSNINRNHNIIEQLISSNMFQRIFQMGLASGIPEIINQTILMFNNGLCFSEGTRKMMLNDPNTIGLVMSFNCPEKERLNEILKVLQYSNQLSVSQSQMMNQNFPM